MHAAAALLAVACLGVVGCGDARQAAERAAAAPHRPLQHVSALAGAETPSGTVPLTIRKFVPAADPAHYDTELDSRTVADVKGLDPSHTVLVVIDFWPGIAPAPLEQNVVGLVQLARRNGIKIVHAPSGAIADIDPAVGAVDDYPREWVANGLDTARFDAFLDAFAIDTILYAGFNDGFCVFYKPLGMDLQRQRTPDRDLVLVRDATVALGELFWIDAWAINAVESTFASTTISDVADALSDTVPLQPYAPANLHDEGYPSDPDFGADIEPSRTALVVVDPWRDDPNDGWSARMQANTVAHLAPLLDLARAVGMKVVFTSDDRPIDPALAPRDDEPVFSRKDALWADLAQYWPADVALPPTARFDGRTYVELGNWAAVYQPGELTLELTISQDAPLPNRKIVCYQKSVGSPYAVFQLRSGDDGSSLLYQFNVGGQWNTVTAPGFFDGSGPVDVAVTHSASTVRIFRGGTLVVEQQVSARLDPSDAQSLRLGARAEKEYWTGTVRDVRLWSVARAPAAIAAGGLPQGDEPGLVGYWRLDEPGGSAVHDASRLGHDGTIVRRPYLDTLVFAGNFSAEAPVFPPLDSWAMTAYNGGATDPWDWTQSVYASRLLEDALIAFESPESLAGEHFKQALLSRSTVYGGARHQVTTAVALRSNLRQNPLAGVWFTPATRAVPPRAAVQFTGEGGSGGYAWSLDANGSGATLTADGLYTAGSVGGSADVVRLIDAAGAARTRTITVTAGVSVSPATATVAPRGGTSFQATGGAGAGFRWSLDANASGGSIEAQSGLYRAGDRGGTRDVVTAKDPLGNVASVTVEVGPGITISPSSAEVAPGGCLALAASGGAGGWSWTAVAMPSGGSVDAVGHYTAGAIGGVSDVVEVADANGNVATLQVRVVAPAPFTPPPTTPPTIPPRSGCATAGGAPWTALLAFAAALGARRRRGRPRAPAISARRGSGPGAAWRRP